MDLESSHSIRATLLDHVDQEGTIVVELSRVTCIDTFGIATLIEALRRARRRGGQVSLVAPSASGRRTLRLFGLEHAFPVYATLGEAIARSHPSSLPS